jgi:hypothetical protein
MSAIKTAAPLGVDDLLTVVEKVICETKDRYAATELRRALDEFAALPIPAPDAQAVAWQRIVEQAAHVELGLNCPVDVQGATRRLLKLIADLSEAALPIPAPDAQAVAWLGEGDGFKSFTRQKSVADRWRKGGIAVTEVYTTPVTGEADVEEAAQIADGWEHTRAGQEIADAIRSLAASKLADDGCPHG